MPEKEASSKSVDLYFGSLQQISLMCSFNFVMETNENPNTDKLSRAINYYVGGEQRTNVTPSWPSDTSLMMLGERWISQDLIINQNWSLSR